MLQEKWNISLFPTIYKQQHKIFAYSGEFTSYILGIVYKMYFFMRLSFVYITSTYMFVCIFLIYISIYDLIVFYLFVFNIWNLQYIWNVKINRKTLKKTNINTILIKNSSWCENEVESIVISLLESNRLSLL